MPELFAGTRSRVASWWDERRAATRETPTAAAPATSGDVTGRLSALADLHGRGELTDEEYASAKARVLAGD
jgi:hypothetical protein